jgi:hypothetical protein
MNRATRALAGPRLLASLAGLLGLLFLVGGRTEVNAGEDKDKSKSVVKVEVTADKPDADGKQSLTVTLEIDPDYSVYANPVGVKSFEEERTRVEVTRDGKPIDVKFAYPEGKLVEVKETGSYRVYEKKVIIKGTVQRTKDDPLPLKVSVRFMASNDKKGFCLLPSVVEQKVP